MKKLLLIVACLATLGGCAEFRRVVTNVNDVARKVCEDFGADYPADFADHARNVLGDDQLMGAEKDGFNPKILCVIPAVVDLFLQYPNGSPDELTAAIKRGE